jgi:hypothetical protein
VHLFGDPNDVGPSLDVGFLERRRGSVGSTEAPRRLACGLASDSRKRDATLERQARKARITCSVRPWDSAVGVTAQPGSWVTFWTGDMGDRISDRMVFDACDRDAG